MLNATFVRPDLTMFTRLDELGLEVVGQHLEQLGMSPEMSHLTYLYNGNARPIMSFFVHFGFSIFFGLLYCVVAEKYPKIKLWQGALFGLVLWIVFHLVLMPAMGTVPAPWDQPFAEHFSEAFGHMFWLWIIELCRRDLRNRITHEPDAEVPLDHALSRSATP